MLQATGRILVASAHGAASASSRELWDELPAAPA